MYGKLMEEKVVWYKAMNVCDVVADESANFSGMKIFGSNAWMLLEDLV